MRYESSLWQCGRYSSAKIVKDNWDFLAKTNTTTNLFNNKIIFGFRRCKNLRDHLVQANIKPPKPNKDSNTNLVAHLNPCKTKTCRYCPKIDHSGQIKSKTTNRTYCSKIRVDCKSNNIIYCITCLRCKIQYVGQTKNRLIDRFGKHFYNITANIQSEIIGRHFNLPDHKGLDDISIHIVDFIHAHPHGRISQKLRDVIEKNWQHRLQTTAPLGLNIED